MTRTIGVKILRYNPAKEDRSSLQDYEVPLESEEGTTVLMILQYIFEKLDRTLSYYYSCKTGKCAGCTVSVNGKTCLACTTVVDGDITIEPASGFKVIKDLVVDFNAPIKTDQ